VGNLVVHRLFCGWVIVAVTLIGMGQTAIGIPCLIAAPILRVAVSAFQFWQKQDRFYLVLTLLLTVTLIYIFFLGVL